MYAKLGLLTTAALLGLAAPARAQVPQGPPPLVEVRPTVGVLFPVGAQRHLFRPAVSLGIHACLEVSDALHVLGSVAWSPGGSRLEGHESRVDVYMYDLGAEFNLLRTLSEDWNVKPFFGAGLGARTYQYHAETLPTNTPLSAYGAVGTELQRGAVALRVEARDYVYSFRHPLSDEARTRHEVGLSAGVALHLGSR